MIFKKSYLSPDVGILYQSLGLPHLFPIRRNKKKACGYMHLLEQGQKPYLECMVPSYCCTLRRINVAEKRIEKWRRNDCNRLNGMSRQKNEGIKREQGDVKKKKKKQKH